MRLDRAHPTCKVTAPFLPEERSRYEAKALYLYNYITRYCSERECSYVFCLFGIRSGMACVVFVHFHLVFIVALFA
jgi:hypothetical protein